MQFQKTGSRSANGVRAPNTVTTDPASKAGPSGRFMFIDENTIQLDLDSGKSVLLFVSKGYTYSEVKPVDDALSAELGASKSSGEDGAEEPAPLPSEEAKADSGARVFDDSLSP